MVELHIRHGEAAASSGWGLTELGKEQVESVKNYLRENFQRQFKVAFHSGSRRATETATLLGFPDVEWVADRRLREVDWKGLPEPRDFAPWESMFDQVGSFCKEIDDRYAGQDRIIVSHGGTMRMVRAYREGLVGDSFRKLFEEPYKYFTNCQIVAYTDEDQRDCTVRSGSLWAKSICPWNLAKFGHDWIKIERPN